MLPVVLERSPTQSSPSPYAVHNKHSEVPNFGSSHKGHGTLSNPNSTVLCLCVCPFIIPWLALARILGNSLLSSSYIPYSTAFSCTDLASVSPVLARGRVCFQLIEICSLFSCLHDQIVAYLSRANSISAAKRQLQSSLVTSDLVPCVWDDLGGLLSGIVVEASG